MMAKVKTSVGLAICGVGLVAMLSQMALPY